MFQIHKRRCLHWLGASALAAGSLLAGCGKKETPAAPPAAAPVAAPAAAPKPEPLKAAWIYVGPVGDAGWSYAHDQARKAMEAEFGDKIKTSFVEKVPEGADAERVLRDLATQGNKLIFATSFGYMEPMLKVAAEFPDVKFEHATGYKTSANLRVYDAKFYEDAYMAGVIAGKMTKSNTLGFVASFPIAEVLRNINAYTLGAQSVNPKVKTKVVWISEWYNPAKESEAAQTLINQGADVLLQNTDSTAVLLTAEKNGKYAFGWDSDMSVVAPKAHLGSAVVIWNNYYKKSIQDVLNKSWTTGRTIWGVKEGQNALVNVGSMVPPEVIKLLDPVKDGLKAGTLEVFTGPIVDSTGKERLAKGSQADQDWKDKVDFYVRGVEGKVPTGK